MAKPSQVLLLLLLAATSASITLARSVIRGQQHFVVPERHLKAVVPVLKNVAVVTTGGTIASAKDLNGNLVPTTSGEQLLAAVPGLSSVANVTGIYEAANIDSSDATPSFWIAVAKVVLKQLKSPDVDAVIVLHGEFRLEG